MRVWLPVLVSAQIVGIILCDRGWVVVAPPYIVLGTSAAACLLARRVPSLAWTLCLASFFGSGVYAMARTAVGPGVHFDEPAGLHRTLDARIRSVSPRAFGLRVELCEVIAPSDRSRGLGGCLALTLRPDEPGWRFFSQRKRGDRVRWRTALRPIDRLRNPGMSTRERSSRRRGVMARASLAHAEGYALLLDAPVGASGDSRSAMSRAMRFRTDAIQRLEDLGEGGTLLAALGLGAADRLHPSTRSDVARLGLAHLLAVSGLHVGLVAALSWAGAGVCIRRLRLAVAFDPESLRVIVTSACATAFSILTGFAAPVQRALMFLLLLVGLHALRRGTTWARAWWLSVAFVLAASPMSLFGLGPQLSFGVTAALCWARFEPVATGRDLGGGWVRALRNLHGVFGMSAVAVSASATILAWHGLASAPVGLLTNLIAVPVTAVFLLPVSLVSVALAGMPAGLPFVDAVLGVAAAAMACIAEGVAELAAVAPVPTAPSGGPSLAIGLSIGSALAAARVRRPIWKAAAALMGLCALTMGQGSGVSSRLQRETTMKPPLFVALDVGQGDALILVDELHAIVVDTGWASPDGGFDAGDQVVLPALRALGIDHVDLLVLTHADRDHRGGAAALVEGIAMSEIRVPGTKEARVGFSDLERLARSHGIRWTETTSSSRALDVGRFRLRALWPPPDHRSTSRNDASLVLTVESAGTRILLMGDAGFEVERSLMGLGAELRADVLKAGHHGSATASSALFLRAVSPQWVVLTAGCGARRRLPDIGTLSRLKAEGRRLAWTGRAGALAMTLGEYPLNFEALVASPARLCARSPGMELPLPPFGGSRRLVPLRERR